VTPQEVELVVDDAVDVFGPEAPEVVDRIADEFAARRSRRGLLDGWQGAISSRSPTWKSTGAWIRVARRTGR
jgi:hypothetical protein